MQRAIAASAAAEAKPDTLLLSQLQNISTLLFQKASKKTLSVATAAIRCNREQLIAALKFMTVSHKSAALIVLIDHFQIKPQQLLTAKDIPPLYVALGQCYQTSLDFNSTEEFFRHYVNFKNVLPFDRHDVCYRLAFIYKISNQLDKTDEFLKRAYQMEAQLDGRSVRNSGVITRLLEAFQKYVVPDFDASFFFVLEKAFEFAPKDPRLPGTIDKFVTTVTQGDPQKLNPGLLEFCVRIARFYPETRKHVSVIESLSAKLVAIPDAGLKQANTYFEAKEYDKAIAVLQKKLVQDPTDIDTVIMLGNYLCVQQKPTEALPYFRGLYKGTNLDKEQRLLVLHSLCLILITLEEPEEVLVFAEEALAISPENPIVLAQRILAYNALGKVRKAKQLYFEANARFPHHESFDACRQKLIFHQVNPFLDESTSPEIFQKEMIHHNDNDECELAKQKAFLLLKKQPNNLAAHTILGHIFYREGDHPKSLEHLEAAKTISPAHCLPLAYVLIAGYYHSGSYLKAYEEARFILQQEHLHSSQQKIRRTLAYATLMAVVICHAVDKYQESITLLSGVLNQENINRDEKISLHCDLARLYYQQEEYKAAERHVNQARELAPLAIPLETYSVFGNIYFVQGKYADARKCYERYLVAKPDNAHTLWNIGLTCYFLDPAQTLFYFSRLLVVDPSYYFRLTFLLPAEDLEKILPQLEKPGATEVKSEAKEGPVAKVFPVELPEPPQSESTPNTASLDAAQEVLPINPGLPPRLLLSAAEELPSPPKPKPKEPKRLTHEQLLNQMFEDQKRRRTLELQAKLRHEEEEKVSDGFDIPGMGFIPLTDPRLVKLAFKGYPKEPSHLFALLDTHKIDFSLEKECCADRPAVIENFQNTHILGNIVGDTNQAGYVHMDETESARFTPEQGPVYTMKLKRLGLFGDARGLARPYVSRKGDHQVMVVDRIVMKTHFGS